ncbi:MAG: hypothetical protein U0744_05095 [Gemmataceae bacterium]
MSLDFFVVHEAAPDFVTGTELADRILVEAVDWPDSESVAFHRRWHYATPGGAKQIGLRFVGMRFDMGCLATNSETSKLASMHATF